ncbi:hypothetical protein AQJ43_23645 [Streptomyces avermitilis]|uniref:hypothetical protein n=1 Tax=Streptomyces TaxID=1883 RepID=UPI00031D162E|nr:MULTISPECIES: hypothetical protein [Streptomyces]KUN52223.1 hypothetical protein AQJ43_23645 [Streptomyces avermitilis]OOV30729.1 hypothetical protein SM007_16125 [Streptomyces avermitilis]
MADALALEDSETAMHLGVLLALAHQVAQGQPARIHEVLSQTPEIPEGATRGEYAALLRLTVLEVHPLRI